MASMPEPEPPMLLLSRPVKLEDQPGMEVLQFTMGDRQFTARVEENNVDSSIKFRAYEGEIPHVLIQAKFTLSDQGRNIFVESSTNLQMSLQPGVKGSRHQSDIVARVIKEVVLRQIAGVKTWYSDSKDRRNEGSNMMYEELKKDPSLHVEDPKEENGYRYVVTAA